MLGLFDAAAVVVVVVVVALSGVLAQERRRRDVLRKRRRECRRRDGPESTRTWRRVPVRARRDRTIFVTGRFRFSASTGTGTRTRGGPSAELALVGIQPVGAARGGSHFSRLAQASVGAQVRNPADDRYRFRSSSLLDRFQQLKFGPEDGLASGSSSGITSGIILG